MKCMNRLKGLLNPTLRILAVLVLSAAVFTALDSHTGLGVPIFAAETSADSESADAAKPGVVDDARIINAATTEPGSWLTYGQTYKEQRF